MALLEIQAFEELVDTLNRRWGAQVIAPTPEWQQPRIRHIATGYPALDSLLGAGGIPLHHLTTLVGSGTAGITSLAYTLIAQAQHQECIGVYIDPAQTFDPPSAQQCGVDLDLLLLVRPGDWSATLSLVRDMVDIEVAALAVLDAAGPEGLDRAALTALELTLNRVTPLLPHSTWTVVLLLPEPLPSLPDHFSVLRLRCAGQMLTDHYPPRLQAEVHVLKDKFGPVGGHVSFTIHGGQHTP